MHAFVWLTHTGILRGRCETPGLPAGMHATARQSPGDKGCKDLCSGPAGAAVTPWRNHRACACSPIRPLSPVRSSRLINVIGPRGLIGALYPHSPGALRLEALTRRIVVPAGEQPACAQEGKGLRPGGLSPSSSLRRPVTPPPRHSAVTAAAVACPAAAPTSASSRVAIVSRPFAAATE